MKKSFSLLVTLITILFSNAQNVGIGTTTPVAILDVNSPSAMSSKFNGPNQMFIGFYETNVLRGYLGSYSGASEDFDIGTSTNNTNGKFHFTIQALPKMTIDNAGNVGIGTTSPSSSSLLEMNSTSKGFLMPRMTTAQRTAIVSPANGLMVYDITTNTFWYHNGTAWEEMYNTGGSLSLPYAATNASAESFKITNTLSGGTAIYGKATNTNPNSVGILGEGTGGSSVGVRAKNTSGFAIFADATPTGALSPVIKGMSNSATLGVGVMGESNGASGRGLYGSSAAGIGVEGYGNDATAIGIKGNSLAGTGVKAYSFSGTALDVEGNLKIAGGNTNPSAGAVLTSDASGNAKWSNIKIAFQAQAGSTTTLAAASTVRLKFSDEFYDPSNNFNPDGAASDKNTFIAPVNGLYHFDAKSTLHIASSTTNISYAHIDLLVNGVLIRRNEYQDDMTELSFHSYVYAVINEDLHLNAGDKVTIEVTQINITNITGDAQNSRFSGHLVFAD